MLSFLSGRCRGKVWNIMMRDMFDFDEYYAAYRDIVLITDTGENEYPHCRGAIVNNMDRDHGLIPPGKWRPTPSRAAPKSQGRPGSTRLSSGAAHKATLYKEPI